MDSHGRVFYVDHVNRTTTWQRPSQGGKCNHGIPRSGSTQQMEQLNRRWVGLQSETATRVLARSEKIPWSQTLSRCRYQNIQRTMATEEDGGSPRLERSSSTETDSDPPPAGTQNLCRRKWPRFSDWPPLCRSLAATGCVSAAGPASPVSQQKISHLLQSPAVKFITHPEFFTVLHSNYVSVTQTLTQVQCRS